VPAEVAKYCLAVGSTVFEFKVEDFDFGLYLLLNSIV
jgi:hypothetical protein